MSSRLILERLKLNEWNQIKCEIYHLVFCWVFFLFASLLEVSLQELMGGRMPAAKVNVCRRLNE